MRPVAAGRLPDGGADLRDDGFQRYAKAGRRLTANSSLLRSRRARNGRQTHAVIPFRERTFPPAPQWLKSESRRSIPAATSEPSRKYR